MPPSITLSMFSLTHRFFYQLLLQGGLLQLLHNMDFEDKFLAKGMIFVFRMHIVSSLYAPMMVSQWMFGIIDGIASIENRKGELSH